MNLTRWVRSRLLARNHNVRVQVKNLEYLWAVDEYTGTAGRLRLMQLVAEICANDRDCASWCDSYGSILTGFHQIAHITEWLRYVMPIEIVQPQPYVGP